MLLVAVGAATTAQGVFTIAGAVVLAGAVLAIVALPAQGEMAERTRDIDWEYSDNRALAAQSALRGVVVRASASRKTNSPTYVG